VSCRCESPPRTPGVGARCPNAPLQRGGCPSENSRPGSVPSRARRRSEPPAAPAPAQPPRTLVLVPPVAPFGALARHPAAAGAHGPSVRSHPAETAPNRPRNRPPGYCLRTAASRSAQPVPGGTAGPPGPAAVSTNAETRMVNSPLAPPGLSLAVCPGLAA
jgi:hypothetical protein